VAVKSAPTRTVNRPVFTYRVGSAVASDANRERVYLKAFGLNLKLVRTALNMTQDEGVDRQRRVDTPIFASQRKPGLSPADIATNEFIDPGIGLPAGK
jgi:hypothetical protein